MKNTAMSFDVCSSGKEGVSDNRRTQMDMTGMVSFVQQHKPFALGTRTLRPNHKETNTRKLSGHVLESVSERSFQACAANGCTWEKPDPDGLPPS